MHSKSIILAEWANEIPMLMLESTFPEAKSDWSEEEEATYIDVGTES